jgi:ABC-type branched-subunit amino acid transport system substrate-binding protein
VRGSLRKRSAQRVETISASRTRTNVSRRRFLGGVAAGTLGLSPFARAIGAMPSSGALRLGIVLPPSARYPEMADELLSGFHAFTDSAKAAGGRRLALIPIACAAGPRAPLISASDAVNRGAVDMLAGFVDTNLAGQMTPLLEAHGIPFVVSDMGADVVRKRWASPLLGRNSLGCWQASYALAQWAPGNLGTRALVVADFLESGYDMVYAFRRAFEASGGEVVALHATGLPDGSGSFESVKQAIESQRPDFVFAFFSGHRAERFVQFYESERLSRVAPLAGTGLLTHAPACGRLCSGAEGIITAASWEDGETSPFAMLGYETAQRIAMGLARHGADLADPIAAARSIAAAEVVGPRGRVAAHDAMGESAPPVFVRRVSMSNGRLVNATIACLPAIDPPADACREMRAMIKTGWAQAYLAA